MMKLPMKSELRTVYLGMAPTSPSSVQGLAPKSRGEAYSAGRHVIFLVSRLLLSLPCFPLCVGLEISFAHFKNDFFHTLKNLRTGSDSGGGLLAKGGFRAPTNRKM